MSEAVKAATETLLKKQRSSARNREATKSTIPAKVGHLSGRISSPYVLHSVMVLVIAHERTPHAVSFLIGPRTLVCKAAIAFQYCTGADPPPPSASSVIEETDQPSLGSGDDQPSRTQNESAEVALDIAGGLRPAHHDVRH